MSGDKRNPYGLQVPCAECPFTRGDKAARLTRGRVRELADNMLSGADGEFHCHKTADYTGVDEQGVSAPAVEQSMHCAGALIFAEKNGNATQMMRIAERLGMYDAAAVMGNTAAVARVFDTRAEMLKTAVR